MDPLQLKKLIFKAYPQLINGPDMKLFFAREKNAYGHGLIDDLP